MKQMMVLGLGAALLMAPVARAQDAATEHRLDRLNSQVEDLLASHAELQKRLAALSRELDALREQNRTTGLPATQDDLKRLHDAIKEVDRKRLEDYDKIRAEIQKLGQAISSPPPPPKKTRSAPPPQKSDAGTQPEKGFWYVIEPGDTLLAIVQAYREQDIHVTVDDIVKANPGLKPNALRVGQKIFIPAPDK
ncbi:MAG: LysM domain protein [Verrucomicrobia bacterium ADurb.Bin118]|jgi:Tfp pilus assembly protein FimV|nr:MAG: LysM domain protein [Verrucomicrobia bacterium ADurb.Bin118]